MVRGKLTENVNSKNDMLFTSDRHRLSKRNVLAADALYGGSRIKNQIIMIRVINPMMKHNVLYKGTKLGRVEVIDDCRSVNMLDNVEEKDSEVVVKEILESHANKLNRTQLLELEKILNRFKLIFSRSSTDVGCIKDVKHEIDTGNQKPIAINPRRIPIHVEGKVDELVEDLEQKDIIVKTVSPWNFPIVVVPKKNGNIRMCVDYRQLNAATERPVYYIPDAKQLFDCLEGAKYFSSLDLSMGYHQVGMNSKDVMKTAFTTRTGQYAFKRMPFGLCGAPQTFQRVMASILREQNWKHCIIYLDDILIFGSTLKEHNIRLCSVLQCLAEAGVKLSPSKCSFMKGETVYLGHVIDGDGLRTDPKKIDVIQKWPVPSTTKELHTFISLCGYYRKFMDGFAKIVRPLEILLRDSKGKLKNWKCIHTEAFDKLKERLTQTPILSFPRKQGMYVLDTDASHETVGAVLSQMQDGEERVIAYASHALTKHEVQYCVTRKELLAVYKYVKHFQHYLLGKNFLIRTDHRALTWMLNWRKPNTSQYCSWIAELENYDFDIEYRKGEQHVNADALSRLPQCHQCEIKHRDPKLKRSTKLLNDTCCNVSRDFEDPIDALVFYLKANCDLDNLDEIELPSGKESAYLWKYRKDLRLINGDTLAINRNHAILSIPRKRNRTNIVKKIHSEFGHIGMHGVKSILKDIFFWPGMDFDIAFAVAGCVLCQQYKHKQKIKTKEHGSLQAKFLFDKVAMDIAGPLKVTKNGYKYILALVDHFSKYPVLVPMKSIDSESIAEAVFTKWISIFGPPNSLHSDRGSNLNSELVMKLCKEFNIQKTKTTPYYPQGDGIVERLFRTVKPLLGIVSEERNFDWSQAIPIVEMGLRNKRCASLGFSPNEIIFGRNVHYQDLTLLNKEANPKRWSMVDYVDRLVRHNHDIQKGLEKSIVIRKAEEKGFRVGDLVWVRRIGSRSGNILFDGPFHVMKAIGKNAFRLQNDAGRVIDRNIIYLKKCVNSDSKSVGRSTSVQSATSCTGRGGLESIPGSPELNRAQAIPVPPDFIEGDQGTYISRRGDVIPALRRYPLRTRAVPARYGFNNS